MDQKPASAPAPSHPLRWFPEFWNLGQKRFKSQARLMGLSLAVGVVAGLGAIVFYMACQVVFHYALEVVVGYHPAGPGGEYSFFGDKPDPVVLRPWLLLLIPVVGGLLSGLLVFTLAPEAEGHGTDAAIAAYHYKQGQIRPRVPLVKILASALTLGTGGSGGREGPIAQIGAGFGSFLGNLLRLRPTERRLLMAAGMGAGVAAIFRAPLAGALFAAEVLYSSPDLESDVIVPASLASVSAYCTFGIPFGFSPLFSLSEDLIKSLDFKNSWQLVSYSLLALFVTVLAMVYTRTFYGLTHQFHRLKMPRHVKPALGAFLSGALGLGLFYLFNQDRQVLAVLSFGYGILQNALSTTGQAPLSFALVLLAVALGKILTTGLTIGSGGSGGVFGPSMVIGGCGGGALGIVLQHLCQSIPGLVPPLPAFVIVGMAGFFAAAAKTPVSTLIMVSEMTGSYNLLLPTLWVCILAYLASDEQSIYSSQVQSRSRSPAHQGGYVRDVLAGMFVRQFLTPDSEFPTLHPEERLADVIDRLSSTPFQVLPVVDWQGRLLGVVSMEEVYLASQLPNVGGLVVAADLMRSDVMPLHAADRLDRALELFVENDVMALPVVDDSPAQRVIGLVKRSDVSGTYLRRVHGAANAQEPDPFIL